MKASSSRKLRGRPSNSAPSEYRARGYRFPFTRPLVMGILNVTPDSFSDGGSWPNAEQAIPQASRMIAEGADIIDVGGESTRPGSDDVPESEELSRVIPVVKAIVKLHAKTPVSIDTRKATVARAALEAGAAMINDVSGLRDPAMAIVAAEYDVPTVIMHIKGTPKTMQKRPFYKDVVGDIADYFRERIKYCKKHGVTKIILDPGIGFGKTVAHNIAILNGIEKFTALGYPVMIGASRKSFIGKILNAPVEDRDAATTAVTAIAVMNGASIVRVHNVRDNVHAVIIAARVGKG